MKIGDLVEMELGGQYFQGFDEWGIGMIVKMDNSKLKVDPQSTSEYVEVLWPKIGLSWEMPALMKVTSESR